MKLNYKLYCQECKIYERSKTNGKIEAAIERVEQTLKEKVK